MRLVQTPNKNNPPLSKILSTAALAVIGADSADAVTIALSGNNLTSTANNLNFDVTGDGIADFNIAGSNFGPNLVSVNFSSVVNNAAFTAQAYGYSGFYYLNVNSVYVTGGSLLPEVTTSIEFTFTDAFINGGLETEASLEITARNVSPSSQEITLNSITFDTVPEPSSISLLALGAVGLAARRRRVAA